MTTDTRHDREGRSLIEAAAIARALHAQESTELVRHLQAQLHRALEEYCNRRLLDTNEVEADVQVAVVNLRQRLDEAAKEAAKKEATR